MILLLAQLQTGSPMIFPAFLSRSIRLHSLQNQRKVITFIFNSKQLLTVSDKYSIVIHIFSITRKTLQGSYVIHISIFTLKLLDESNSSMFVPSPTLPLSRVFPIFKLTSPALHVDEGIDLSSLFIF